jgi:CheY-like chemotaxis protein
MSWDTSLNGLSVLVVDDNADGRDLAAMVLGLAGATVTTASSGRQALERLSGAGLHGGFDVVVTDISMPDGNGYDLIREARRHGCRLPFIALTALETPEHRRRMQSSGFACQLT